MRYFLASLFRLFFRTGFRKTYYGFYKRIFIPWKLFRGVKKKINYRGSIKMKLDLEDWNQQGLYFTRDVEEKEMKFLEQCLRPGDIFIDLGANIGQFSLVAAKMVGENGRVYAFEPWPENFEALQSNIRLNNFQNITTEKKAVTDKEGSIELRLDQAQLNKGMVTAYTNTFTAKETVPAISLDQYFSGKQLNSLRLIKIDIEGGEYEALEGMRGILRKYKPRLLIEILPETIQHIQKQRSDVEKMLNDLGYKKYFLNNQGTQVSEKLRKDISYNYLFTQ